ncbi:unnamed protein product [Discosporangium mesarthrocarpum]
MKAFMFVVCICLFCLSLSWTPAEGFLRRGGLFGKQAQTRHGGEKRGLFRRRGLRASWIDEQVSLEIPVACDEAYAVYSDLRRHPEWSPWLKSVEHDRDAGRSTWVIQSKGFTISWDAQNMVENPPSEIAWESRTGLSNRGRVTFSEVGSGCCLMTLTLSYNLPRMIGSILQLKFVEKFVKRTLLGDLLRFQVVLTGEAMGSVEENLREEEDGLLPSSVASHGMGGKGEGVAKAEEALAGGEKGSGGSAQAGGEGRSA